MNLGMEGGPQWRPASRGSGQQHQRHLGLSPQNLPVALRDMRPSPSAPWHQGHGVYIPCLSPLLDRELPEGRCFSLLPESVTRKALRERPESSPNAHYFHLWGRSKVSREEKAISASRLLPRSQLLTSHSFGINNILCSFSYRTI